MDYLIKIRNDIHTWIYSNIVKPIAFKFSPEGTHVFFVKVGKILGKYKLTKLITRDLYYYENNMISQRINNIEFKNPVGLSAGFDKNAEIISICEDVGFGFSEVGSVTKGQYSGNEGVRLMRLKKQKSLWINLGLNNNGINEISNRLKKSKYNIPFGVSIAKTNCQETANDLVGKKDYIYTLNQLNNLNVGDFYVFNISCPNAFGGQPFSRSSAYESLLKESRRLKISKPLFIKLSPDLTKNELDKILKISGKYHVSGFIISNLTKKHNYGKGGLSGKLVENLSNKMIKYVYDKTKGKYVIIGVGGIFSAEDAYKKIRLGASLVELITGMIYCGPNLISEINQGLVELLKRDGFDNIKQAIGMDVK